jgi:Ser/Thr protein kinase RdoA (MazF antagonist)
MDPSGQTLEQVIAWCASVLGPIQVLSDDSKDHPGLRAGACRIRTARGPAYLKIHRDPSHWNSEVHAYERWAPAFGPHAPRLLAVRAVEPLALVITELPGRILESVRLAPVQERAVWRSAGQALAGLHAGTRGTFFGPCLRDGSCGAGPVTDPCEYVRADFANLLGRAAPLGCLDAGEHRLIQAAMQRIPAFTGELPIPCHRDYCAANWLVSDGGEWTGVIDFEFSRWDLRVSDFARDPDWNWVRRPDLVEALFTGYSRGLTAQEEEQRMISCAQYALTAIVWGMENAYHGFAEEGRQALRWLSERLP